MYKTNKKIPDISTVFLTLETHIRAEILTMRERHEETVDYLLLNLDFDTRLKSHNLAAGRQERAVVKSKGCS